MKKRSNLLLYLLLNVLVSAGTTLGVLVIWDHARRAEAPVIPPVAEITLPPQVAAESTIRAAASPTAAAQTVATPVIGTAAPVSTLPPVSQPVIQILTVVGAGDLEQEVVLLKRVGEGNVRMVGWKLKGENKNTYTFPEQPELIVYKDGAVQVHTKAGTDTATDVYWNRSDAAWRSGETITLFDPQGKERATYRVP